jgi:hypothetical protein
MRVVVRTRDRQAADELFAALKEVGADVSRQSARSLLVADSDEDVETELGFFLRAWEIARPATVVGLEHPAQRPSRKLNAR